jgi:hypothetical protein
VLWRALSYSPATLLLQRLGGELAEGKLRTVGARAAVGDSSALRGLNFKLSQGAQGIASLGKTAAGLGKSTAKSAGLAAANAVATAGKVGRQADGGVGG